MDLHQENTANLEPVGSESISNSLRVNFVLKVFGITAIQLAFTSILAYLAISSSGFSTFQKSNPRSILVAFIPNFVLHSAINASDTLTKKVPLNYIILGVFTLDQSYIVSVIANTSDKEVVFSTIFVIAAVVSVLALYALRSKTEINMMRGLILLLSLASPVILVLSWIMSFKFMASLYFGVIAIMSGLFLIYDIKKIMGKENRKISLDDYIRGALMLYGDITWIFLAIHQIEGKEKEN